MVTRCSFAPALALGLMTGYASGCGHVERPRAEPAVPLGRGLVSVGPSWSCGQLGHGYFECWKPSWSGGPAQSPGSLSWKLARSAEMIAGADRVCVGDPVGNVRCSEDIDLSDTWHFDLAGHWVCASLRCGGVVCSDGNQTHRVDGLAGQVDQVFVRADGQAIALKGDRVFAWTLDRASLDPPQARRLLGLDSWQAYVAIRTCSAGPLGRCANIHSRSLAGLRELHDVALGPAFGCGLDDSGRVACAYFGSEDVTVYVSRFFAGVADPVERGVVYSMGDFVAESVDVATSHACARSAAGEVRCWGGGQGCHTRSSLTCGELRIEPRYIGVDLRVDASDVARGEARRYVIPWETGSNPDAEIHLDLESEHFERLARGEWIGVEARVVWTGDGEARIDERTLRYTLSCRHDSPVCR